MYFPLANKFRCSFYKLLNVLPTIFVTIEGTNEKVLIGSSFYHLMAIAMHLPVATLGPRY